MANLVYNMYMHMIQNSQKYRQVRPDQCGGGSSLASDSYSQLRVLEKVGRVSLVTIELLFNGRL